MMVKKVLSDLSIILDQGWLSRLFLFAQFYLAYFMVDWAMAFGSTALATKADLLGAASVIGAVAAVPQALLMLATNKYIEMRYARDFRASSRESNRQADLF